MDEFANFVTAAFCRREICPFGSAARSSLHGAIGKSARISHRRVGYNYAASLNGIQMALVNQTKSMRGFQLGLVNVASDVEKGFQLGLFNFADSSKGAQVGLLSITRDVPVRFQVFTSDMHAFNVAVRYGTKYLYGIALGGLQPFEGSTRGAYGIGLGMHIPFWRLFIDIDSAFSMS